MSLADRLISLPAFFKLHRVKQLTAFGGYANKENFHHAIQDFEEALSINPKHSNARNYLIETLLAFGKTCEDDHNFEEATIHYAHVLKVDPDHTEAKELIRTCQYMMVEVQKKKEGKHDSSILSKTADKLRQLIQEDKEEEMRKKNYKRQSSGSSEKSRKRRRSNSDSSSTSSSSSSTSSSRSSSSSSSSAGRRRQRKKFRPSSSVNEQQRRRTERDEKNPDIHGHSEGKSLIYTDPEDKSENAGSAKTAFLPVSSFEYFSDRAEIPGLGSPPPAIQPEKGEVIQQPEQDHMPGRNEEAPEKNVKMLRRDDFLMAEREKFYRDNKDAYKRYPSVTRSRSSSSSQSSQSPSCSTSASKRSERSQSKSRTERSPCATGIKELGRYLGGAKELLNRLHSKDKPTNWTLFSDLFSMDPRSSSHFHNLNFDNSSHSKEFRSSPKLSEDNDVSSQCNVVRSQRCEKEEQVCLLIHGKGKGKSDKYLSTSGHDGAGKEVQEKWNGKHLGQGHSKEIQPHCSVAKGISVTGNSSSNSAHVKRSESSNLEQLKLTRDEGNSVTAADRKGEISATQLEREKSKSTRVQDKCTENRTVDQVSHGSVERNQEQSLKAFKHFAGEIEKDSSYNRNKSFEADIGGLNLQHESQHTEKQRQYQLQKVMDESSCLDDRGHSVSSRNSGRERSRRSRSTDFRKSRNKERKRSIERMRSRTRSKSRSRRKSRSKERDMMSRGGDGRLTKDQSANREYHESHSAASKGSSWKYNNSEMRHRRKDRDNEDTDSRNRMYSQHRDVRLSGTRDNAPERKDSKWVRLQEMEEEIERRVYERLKQEAIRQKEIAHVTKSKWDSERVESRRAGTSRWNSSNENRSQSISNTNMSQSNYNTNMSQSNSDTNTSQVNSNKNMIQSDSSTSMSQSLITTDMRRNRWDSKVGSTSNVIMTEDGNKVSKSKPKQKGNVEILRYSGISKSASNTENSNSNPSNIPLSVNRTQYKPHAELDTDDTITGKKGTVLEAIGSREKIIKGNKLSIRESLSDLEKFLIGLKEQKKKQWIAEGKLKNKK